MFERGATRLCDENVGHRWGFALNVPSQPCQSDGSDSVGNMGFGISGESHRMPRGAGWSDGFAGNHNDGSDRKLDAWLWVR